MNIDRYEYILFDWGDTIMKDFPGKTGKMRYWDIVEEIPNAKKVLRVLSTKMKCYLATSAQHSEKEDIIEALKRIDINQYFTDIFCYREIGYKKSETQFYKTVLSILNIDPKKMIMIGNELENDVRIPISCGIKAILFDPNNEYENYPGDKIHNLIDVIGNAEEQTGGAEFRGGL
jgi:putative hydrolase of the HAD superfamily